MVKVLKLNDEYGIYLKKETNGEIKINASDGEGWQTIAVITQDKRIGFVDNVFGFYRT